MTAAAKPDKQNSAPRRKRLKWLGWGLVFVAAICALFHHPVLVSLTRFAVGRIASSQHLHVEYDLGGSILSDITLRNVRVWAVGRSPVDKINIQEVHADYSLAGLLRHGAAHFITNCVVKNANMVFKDPDEGKPRPADAPNHFTNDFHGWVFPPAFLVAHIEVENLNILAHSPDWEFIMRSTNASITRGQSGWVKIESMKIPNLREWKNVTGEVQTTDHSLSLQNVKISPDLTVVNILSAPVDGGVSSLTLNARLSNGSLTLNYSDRMEGDHYQAKITGDASEFSLEGLRKFLDSSVPITGNIHALDLQCDCQLGVPSTWKGVITSSITSPAGIGMVKVDHADARVTFESGTLSLVSHEFGVQANKASLDAGGKLPDRIDDLGKMAIDGRFQLSAPQLSESTAVFTNGSILAEGQFHMQSPELSVNMVASGKDINSEKCDVGELDVKADVSRVSHKDQAQAHAIDNYTGNLTARFKNARIDKYALDSGQLTAEGKDGKLMLNATDLKRETNSATARATWRIPADFSQWTAADFEIGFTLSAPDIAALNAEPNLTGLNGQCEAGGFLSRRDGVYEGKFNADGTSLVVSDFNARSLHVAGVIENSLVKLNEAQFVIDAKNQLSGTASVDLRSPNEYAATLQANMNDLGAFNALLKDAGVNIPIGGSLTVNWSGSGKIAPFLHTGEGQIKLTGGKVGAILPISAEIAGKYSPETVDIPTLHVLADKTDFRAQVDLHDTQLKIHSLLLQQNKVKLLMGEINLPLDLRTPMQPDTLIPPNGRIFSNLTSDEINLDTLLIQPGLTSPFKGTLKVSINADGPLDNLLANILVRGRNLQLKSAPSLAPGNLELNVDLKDNQFSMLGTLQQPAISPLQITGKFPFPLQQILRDRKIDENTPVDLSVKLDKSPVTLFSQLFPKIRYIEGQMAIDAKAGGTIAKPQLSGAASLDLPAIRFSDPDAPAINNIKSSMDFTGNQLTVRNLGGEISGGPFNFTGKVLFDKLTTPVLDLRLTSQNALLMRNETLTVRADSDLKIAGPFNAANVTGNVGITKSKFFREVEILPIELPGRPAPKPSTESQIGFSLKPPLAKWTFNVAIKTKDPFLIRGNFTNGAAHADLKLVGTGAAPALEGTVHVDNFVASLPFSKLNIEHGYAYFSADDPFMPTLDIEGTSSLRDYNIRAYISGTLLEPVTVFTSDPPLPQEEIVSLLGTGATTEELTGNGNVLAGRAAVLLFQDLYRRIFKEKPQENESFLTRFELDPGAIDPRTGKQEVTARFKVTDHYYLIGDIDAQGEVRGLVKYLIRFR